MSLFFLVLGFFFGSFLNVLADRIPNKRNPFVGRSSCDYCHKTLTWRDLIPLVSFLLTGGKCRYCKHKLSFYYPIAEFCTGVLFALTYILFSGNLLQLVYALFIVSVMISIFFADLKYGIIPDMIVFPSILITFVYLLLVKLPLVNISSVILSSGGTFSLLPFLLSGLGSFLLFLFLFVSTKGRAMGFGDVKFAFLLGLILGPFATIIMLYVAFLTGAAVGIILILWKKKNLRHAIPFGPFLAAGFLVSLFLGPQITNIALGFL